MTITSRDALPLVAAVGEVLIQKLHALHYVVVRDDPSVALAICDDAPIPYESVSSAVGAPEARTVPYVLGNKAQ